MCGFTAQSKAIFLHYETIAMLTRRFIAFYAHIFYFHSFLFYWIFIFKQANVIQLWFLSFFFLSDMTLLTVCVLFSLSLSCTHSVTYRETSMQSVLNLPIKCNCFTMLKLSGHQQTIHILSAHGSKSLEWGNVALSQTILSSPLHFTTLGCWHDACTLHTQLRFSLNVHTWFWMEIVLKAVAFSLC